jgi:hypothetical protein
MWTLQNRPLRNISPSSHWASCSPCFAALRIIRPTVRNGFSSSPPGASTACSHDQQAVKKLRLVQQLCVCILCHPPYPLDSTARSGNVIQNQMHAESEHTLGVATIRRHSQHRVPLGRRHSSTVPPRVAVCNSKQPRKKGGAQKGRIDVAGGVPCCWAETCVWKNKESLIKLFCKGREKVKKRSASHNASSQSKCSYRRRQGRGNVHIPNVCLVSILTKETIQSARGRDWGQQKDGLTRSAHACKRKQVRLVEKYKSPTNSSDAHNKKQENKK